MVQKVEDDTHLELGNRAEGTGITVLQSVLADTIFLQSLYKKYHWHVAGEDFYQYHLLFDKHAGELIPIIDAVAEHIRTLGGLAPGLPHEVDRNKTADEGPEPKSNAQKMLKNLLRVHKACIKNVRSGIRIGQDVQDEGTVDMLVSQVLRTHEQQSWFVRSSLG